MRSVTVFVEGQLRQKTYISLLENCRYPIGICLHQVSKDDPFGYANVLSSYWASAESFFIVEPDIVIRKDVVDQFSDCEHPYCAYPYAWTTNIGPALGCTRFHSEFLLRYPDAMKEASSYRVSWQQLDVLLMRRVLAREYGEQPHVHLPPVVHLNEQKRLLPEADPTPMMEVPLW